MIIPNSVFDYSSMIVQSNNSSNYMATESGPATSAIPTDGALELNVIHKKDFFSQELLMQSTSLQASSSSSSPSSEAFGWGDFPLLQQSMVAVAPLEVRNVLSRSTSIFRSEPSPFVDDYESSFFASSSKSFDTMSFSSSTPSLCSSDDLSQVSSSSSSKVSRKVQFASVQIREYALTLGDHPWCEDGFPLSLDWKFASQQELNIDDYEHDRINGSQWEKSSPRRLDVWERRNLLRRVSGFTTSELNRMERMRMEQQQRESFYCCHDVESESTSYFCESSSATTSISRTSRMLRHSNSMQNLASACV